MNLPGQDISCLLTLRDILWRGIGTLLPDRAALALFDSFRQTTDSRDRSGSNDINRHAMTPCLVPRFEHGLDSGGLAHIVRVRRRVIRRQ